MCTKSFSKSNIQNLYIKGISSQLSVASVKKNNTNGFEKNVPYIASSSNWSVQVLLYNRKEPALGYNYINIVYI